MRGAMNDLEVGESVLVTSPDGSVRRGRTHSEHFVGEHELGGSPGCTIRFSESDELLEVQFGEILWSEDLQSCDAGREARPRGY